MEKRGFRVGVDTSKATTDQGIRFGNDISLAGRTIKDIFLPL